MFCIKYNWNLIFNSHRYRNRIDARVPCDLWISTLDKEPLRQMAQNFLIGSEKQVIETELDHFFTIVVSNLVWNHGRVGDEKGV